MRRPISLKSDTCPKSLGVYTAGISVKVRVSYPARSANLPWATGIGRCREGLAEVSRALVGELIACQRAEPVSQVWVSGISDFSEQMPRLRALKPEVGDGICEVKLGAYRKTDNKGKNNTSSTPPLPETAETVGEQNLVYLFGFDPDFFGNH